MKHKISMRPSALGLVRCILLFLALSLAGTASAASPEHKAGARAAAESGFDAYQAGDYEKALDYFERAEELVHAPPHLLYLARSNEKLGRLVRARELYLSIQREELSVKSPKAFRAAQQDAAEELEALEPRIPTVAVELMGEGTDDDGLEVTRDGEPLPPALVGIPQPMDPGQYTFVVRGPTTRSDPQTITVEEGATAIATLTVERVQPAPSGAVSSSGDITDAGGKGASAMRIAGYSSLGVGVVGVGIGTAFLIQGMVTQSDADAIVKEECGSSSSLCQTERQDEIEGLDADAANQKTIAVVGLGVGGAALVTGVVLLVLDSKRRKKESTSAFTAKPWVGFQSLGVSGTF